MTRVLTTLLMLAPVLGFSNAPLAEAQAAQAASAQTAAESRAPEAHSLFGEPLYAPELPPEQRATQEAALAQAQAAYDRQPASEEAIVWLGRRLAYLGRYRDALDVYTKGVQRHPKSAALHRHRGHRYISVRAFDQAIADLEQAATLIEGQPDAIEPDGAPNAKNVPRSTLHSNIWYHLALAYYLKGDFVRAKERYRTGMKSAAVNDDMLVAMTDWYYMTCRRLGQVDEAKALLEPIREQMDVIENTAYHQRLLMYKGVVTPESLLGAAIGGSTLPEGVQLATQGYGVGNWYLYNGDVAKAREVFERVTKGGSWSAFGFIAAEADLKRGLEAVK